MTYYQEKNVETRVVDPRTYLLFISRKGMRIEGKTVVQSVQIGIIICRVKWS